MSMAVRSWTVHEPSWAEIAVQSQPRIGAKRAETILPPADELGQWKARALAAEAALKLVAEQDVTEIALDPDWPRRICAAAIRAQGE